MNKRHLEKTVRWILYVMLMVTVLTALIALVDKRTGSETPAADAPVSEAPVGSFESTAFNEGWVMTEGGKDRTITLPYREASIHSKELTIRNTLPSDLEDGMSLITFSSMADIYIRINGVLRESYSSETMKNMPYFIPSAYNVVELTREDAGKEISITVVPKASINLNEVYFGYGNNVWFRIIRNHVAKIAIALVVIVLGIILAIISKIMQRISASAGTGFFLGLFMVDFATWIFSESELRQLIFQRPSMSQYFSYLAMELFAPLAATYFDAVQDKRHHRAYSFIITLSTLQIIVNVVLHFTGLLEFYQTLPASHMWLAIGIILTAVNVIRDIHSGMIRQYLATAIGMIILLFAGVFELMLFYRVRFYSIGIVSSLGLIFLAAATLVQNLMDQIRIARQREEEHSRMVINTIESIAVAIDAKDEGCQMTGFYGMVEKLGNRIPGPAFMFMGLFVITYIASFIMSAMGVSAVNPVTGKTVSVINLFTSANTADFLQNINKRWMNFAPLLTVPVCTVGLAIASRTGLLEAGLRLTGHCEGIWSVALIVSFIGVNANLVGDAAFLIFPPLVAMLFKSVHRNPLAGLFLGYASVPVGFGANLLIGSADASLAGLTQAAAVIVDADFVANAAMGWYYLFASTALCTASR